MNRAHRAARNTAIRSRRAKGVLIKTIAIEFGLSVDSIHLICSDVPRARLRGRELVAVSAKRKTIALDAQTLALIEDAKRNPAPPYKGQGSWPV